MTPDYSDAARFPVATAAAEALADLSQFVREHADAPGGPDDAPAARISGARAREALHAVAVAFGSTPRCAVCPHDKEAK